MDLTAPVAQICSSVTPLSRRARNEPMSMQNSQPTTVAAFSTASSTSAGSTSRAALICWRSIMPTPIATLRLSSVIRSEVATLPVSRRDSRNA